MNDRSQLLVEGALATKRFLRNVSVKKIHYLFVSPIGFPHTTATWIASDDL